MADPTWIKKTAVLSLVLALPALALLAEVLRTRSTRTSPGQSFALWTGLVLVVSYFGWFLNVAFEWSVGLMIAWPLFGIAKSTSSDRISGYFKANSAKAAFARNVTQTTAR